MMRAEIRGAAVHCARPGCGRRIGGFDDGVLLLSKRWVQDEGRWHRGKRFRTDFQLPAERWPDELQDRRTEVREWAVSLPATVECAYCGSVQEVVSR